MPALSCPACTRSLPVKQIPPQGTLVQCPLCQASFVLGRDAPLPLELAEVTSQAADGVTAPKSSIVPLAIAGGVIVAGLAALMLAVALGAFSQGTAVAEPAADEPLARGERLKSDLSRKRKPQPAPQASPVVASPAVLPPAAAPSAPEPAVAIATNSAATEPPLTPTASSSPAGDVPSLAYKWRRGMQYPYHFEIKPTGGRDPAAYSGMITYIVADEKTPLAAYFAEAPELREGTGTAFVVHSSGLLVTCEHVVRGAAKIQLTLGGKQYDAKIVAADRKRDLALLQIEAQGLAALPLGDSEQVGLAEAVRAAGYPLSDVLGSSLKITSGTVSGIVERSGRRQLQIDAPLNPGNSGGPVLDARGQVVGVCGSDLTGRALTNVGLAVPASDVHSLLKQHGLAGDGTPAREQMAGPDLARRIAPAVAFVKVTVGIDQESMFGLSFMCFGHATYGFSTANPAPANGSLVVDKQGEIVSERGDASLPFQLGTYAALGLEAMPAGDELAWEQERTYVLTSIEVSPSEGIGPLPGRYRPFAPSPFAPRFEASVVPVVEHVSYERLRIEGDKQFVRKRYELVASGKNDDSRPLAVTGEGELQFDLKLGVVSSAAMKYEIRQSAGNVSIKQPVELTCSLGKVENHAERMARVRTEVKEKKEKELAERPAKLKQIIADLAGESISQQRFSEIFSTLLLMEPLEEFRQPLSEALDKHLLSKDLTVSNFSFSILEKWGSEYNVPTLLKALEATEPVYRYRVLENIGRYSRDPKVAEKVAGYLHSESEHYNAARALKLMGSVAEDAVLKLITPEASERMQNDICDVLGDIGTRKSVPVLEKLAAQDKGTLKFRAESALRAIDRRMPDTGKP